MVMINKGSVQQNCTDLLDLKQPIQNAQGFIQPTIEVGQRTSNIIRRGTRTTSGSSTLFTTPLDKDFFLTHFNHCVTKDAASDGIQCAITVTVDGAATVLSSINMTTLTATTANQPSSLSYPLKIDRGTNITVGMTTSVGTSTIHGTIIGYLQ